MSDRIVVMNKGRIEQVGTAHEIYERPQTKFVAQFIGETNLFEDVEILEKMEMIMSLPLDRKKFPQTA